MFLPPSRTLRAKSRTTARPSRVRLQVEPLEERSLLAAGPSAALVADVNPGPDGSFPTSLTNVNGTLYFGASNATSGDGLWKSDGTAAGTTLVSTDPGSDVEDLTPVKNGSVVFEQGYGNTGGNLWATDGTAAGTIFLGGAAKSGVTASGGEAFFVNWGPTDQNGHGQWYLGKTDGTVDGTQWFYSFYGDYTSGGRAGPRYTPKTPGPLWLTDLNGTLFFAVNDGQTADGTELWRSDGTKKGTQLVKDIVPGPGSSNPQYLTAVSGTLYFGAAGGLWKSDGTAAGTVLVKSMPSGVSPSLLTNVNGALYFEAPDGAGGPPALWKSNGTAAGTVPVKDVNPSNLTNVNGTLFFTADDGTHGAELWKSNGTASGTVLVRDVAAGGASSSPTDLTAVNGLLYFAADDGVHGNELWQSDGTAAGTVMVQDVNPGSAASDPAYLTAVGNKLYFAATDPVHGRELWGAAAGTQGYRQINLVGYQPGMAPRTDPNLNGWGMDSAPGGPYCVANTATGTATFYDAHGKPLPLVVTIPAAPGQPLGPVGSPTGVVYNPTSDFVISEGGRSAPARFLFDTLDALVCGWNPAVDPTHALILVDNSPEAPYPASYSGLALAKNDSGKYILYAADSGASPTASNNRIDMIDGGWHSVGSFTDARVATQYPGNTVFQVEAIGNRIYVTFGGFTPPFGGVVDVFDTEGRLLTPRHFAANLPGQGPLVNPWAVVLAPAHFGQFSNDLLIGNVEDGRINAFDPVTGQFLGTLQGPDGKPIAIPGLWDLEFGSGGKSGKPDHLYFTAGPDAADFAGNGLFGVILAQGEQHDCHGDHW